MQNCELDILQTVSKWLDTGHSVELITLVNCQGSAPRPIGSIAAVRDDGVVFGSVSGGCIEKELTLILRKSDHTRIVNYTISRDEAVRFGLLCGGEIELVFERIESVKHIREIISILENRGRVCRSLDLKTGTVKLNLAERDQEFLFDGNTLNKVYGSAWRMLLIGAGQLSRLVAQMALTLDYEVLVCEPREHFANAWDVPGTIVDSRMPDELVLSLSSDPRSAVLALAHDPNLDDLALMEALASEVFYVGALGSKKSNNLRCKRLVETLGVNESQLARLHAPIGLDIGSHTPAEIAVSILAEVTAVRNKT